MMNNILKKIINDEKVLSFHKELLIHSRDFSDALDKGIVPHFEILNGSFMVPDAHIYYSMIRKFQPNTIIEIGSGNSTVVANFACGGLKTKITAIDPNEHLSDKMKSLDKVTFLHKMLEDTDINIFKQLKEDDILFIDSSHILKEYNDVCVEVLEILPNLPSGVVIHFHDIYAPHQYGEFYKDGDGATWNEQYLLLAILLNSYQFEVLWPGAYLNANYVIGQDFAEWKQMKDKYPLAIPGAFWIRKV